MTIITTTQEEVIELEYNERLAQNKQKISQLRGYVTNIIPPHDGGYVVMRPTELLPGLRSFTCSIANLEPDLLNLLGKGTDVLAINVHWVSKNKGWRAESLIIMKER